MRVTFTKWIACLVVCCLFGINAQAQWAQLTGTGGTQATYTSVGVAPDGTPYVVFSGNVDGTTGSSTTTDKTQVKRWTGTEWQQVGNAGFSTGGVEWTSIAFSPQGVPYVAFKDKGTVDGVANRMRVARLNGSTWEIIYNSAAEGRYASLAFDNSGVLHLAFRDHANESKAVVMRYSGTGTAWSPVGPETGISTGAVEYTAIAFDNNNNLYLSYSMGGAPAVQRLVGTEWQPVGAESLAGIHARNTDIAIGPNNMPYLLIRSGTEAASAVARVFRLNGTTWENVGPATGFGAPTIDWMNLEVGSDNKLYVGFMEVAGRSAVYTPNAAGTAWEYVGGDRVSTTFNASHTGFAMNKANGNFFISARGASDGNRGLFVWQYTPTTTSAAKDLANKSGVSVYPNPSSSSFRFTAAGKFSYVIYNNAGQVMDRGQGVGEGEAGAALRAGLYFIQLQTEAGSQTLKLLKQ
ncbi:T9SS type A sorting domain-containing protein [Botryobacter ruber]|uniref:T9SS type A sorting domain-containing protein n=1 Tax=Botryobacter ruber TaxID=2171629 RepID=UPI000E0BDD1B|nr:T9SS type A sorting domain-containing protein [Botryobacter ruber]